MKNAAPGRVPSPDRGAPHPGGSAVPSRCNGGGRRARAQLVSRSSQPSAASPERGTRLGLLRDALLGARSPSAVALAAPGALLAAVLAGCAGIAAGAGGAAATTRGASAAEVPAAARVRGCPRGADWGAASLIDDFEDGDARVAPLGGRGGTWYLATDAEGSRLDQPEGPEFRSAEGGSSSSPKRAAHLVGRSARGGDQAWGIELGLGLLEGNAAYDASQYAAISFVARLGDADSGRRMRVSLPDANTHPVGNVCSICFNHFSREVRLTPRWTQYTLGFAELRQRPYWGDPRPDAVSADKLIGVAFQLGGGGRFDVWIDDVQLVPCRP